MAFTTVFTEVTKNDQLLNFVLCSECFLGPKVKTSRVWPKGYTSLLQDLFQNRRNMWSKEKVLELQNEFIRINLVDQNLWVPCVNEKKIKVICHDMLTGTIRFNDIEPICVVQTSLNEVLIGSKQGLYVCNTEGDLQYQVNDVHICDISMVSSTKVIVYDKDNHFVIYFEKTDGRWKGVSCLSLQEETSRLSMNSLQWVDKHKCVVITSDAEIVALTLYDRKLLFHCKSGKSHFRVCGVNSLNYTLHCDKVNKTVYVAPWKVLMSKLSLTEIITTLTTVILLPVSRVVESPFWGYIDVSNKMIQYETEDMISDLIIKDEENVYMALKVDIPFKAFSQTTRNGCNLIQST